MADVRWAIAWWPLLMTVSLGLMLAAASAARAAPDQPGWVLVEGSGAAVRLYAPTSGALLARTSDGMIRSDDGGTTWNPVQLPAGRYRTVVGFSNLIVDPNDHNVLFASVSQNTVPDTIARSIDGGASWTVLTLPPETGWEIANISVSPADPSLVFLSRRLYGMLWQLMSRDRGDTWELRGAFGPGSTCGWGVVAFLPHPTDPEQVYRRAG